jgi:hypothetical protein
MLVLTVSPLQALAQIAPQTHTAPALAPQVALHALHSPPQLPARPTPRPAIATSTTTATLICNVSSAPQGTSALAPIYLQHAPLDPMQSPASPRVPYAPAAPTSTRLAQPSAARVPLAQS